MISAGTKTKKGHNSWIQRICSNTVASNCLWEGTKIKKSQFLGSRICDKYRQKYTNLETILY